MAPIKIYTTPTCPYCKMAKEYFKSKNLEYEEYDVASDAEKRQEMLKLTGQMAVPVIQIDGKVILGFDKGEIDKALEEASTATEKDEKLAA